MAGFSEGIKVFFGGDTTALKASLNEAGAALEKFNEHTDRIQHRLLSGLFGFEALRKVGEWASESIKRAQEVREEFEKLGKPIDEETQRLAEFGDGISSLKRGTEDAVGTVVSYFNLVGQALGYDINLLRGFDAAEQDLNEKTGRAADKQEAKRDAAVKRHAQDGEKAAAQDRQNSDAAFQNQLKGESVDKRLQDLLDERVRLQKELGAIVGDTDTAHLLRSQKQAEIDKNSAAMVENQNEGNRKKAEADKQQGEDALKYVREQDKLTKELHDAKFEGLKDDEKLTQLAAEQSAWEKKIAEDKKTGAESKADELALVKNINEQSAITAKITKENALTEGEITKEKIRQLTAIKNAQISIVGIRGGKQFNQASDETLADVAAKDRAAAFAIQGGAGGYGIGQNLEIARLQAEIKNVQQELDFRNSLRLDYRLGGEAQARANFKGDPLLFDQVFEQIIRGQDVAGQTLEVQRSILSRLQQGILTLPVNAVSISGG